VHILLSFRDMMKDRQKDRQQMTDVVTETESSHTVSV